MLIELSAETEERTVFVSGSIPAVRSSQGRSKRGDGARDRIKSAKYEAKQEAMLVDDCYAVGYSVRSDSDAGLDMACSYNAVRDCCE